MKERIKSLNRLGRLQMQLYNVSAWRLRALEAQAKELGEARENLIAAMNENPAYYGELGRLAGKRLGVLEKRISAVQADKMPHERQLVERAGRLRSLERSLDKVKVDQRNHMERSALAEIIERMVSDKRSS